MILGGDRLAIEYRDPSPRQLLELAPGQVDWDTLTDRIHRAVNVGQETYEEVTVFFLNHPGEVPQPKHE